MREMFQETQKAALKTIRKNADQKRQKTSILFVKKSKIIFWVPWSVGQCQGEKNTRREAL